MLSMTPNKSKTYLLPLILEFFNLPDSLKSNFLNCYLFDTDNLHEDCIYLLYNYDIKNPIFTKFEYEISKTKGYITHYDLKDNQILFVLNFPREYLLEYNYFINGHYSRYKPDSRRIVLSYWYNKIPQVSYDRLEQILIKDPKLKSEIENNLGIILSDDSELGEIIDVEKETINIKKQTINYL